MGLRGAKPAMNSRSLAFVLPGGGALSAYQVGVLSRIAESLPDLDVRVLCGVSAGAINAAALATFEGSFTERVDQLKESWRSLSPEDVFRVDPRSLWSRVGRWGLRLVLGGRRGGPHPRGMVDTEPLRKTLTDRFHAAGQSVLPGVQAKLDAGELDALAITASSHTTGESVTWVQGRYRPWRRAHRCSAPARIGIEHVMASAALPLLFPAIQIEGAWFCDGGVRLTAPLSPAVHLGAERILALTTRYPRDPRTMPQGDDYPPPAQIAGDLLDAIFLDMVDADALRMQLINDLIDGLPPDRRHGCRPIELMVMRPSCDLGELASEFEPRLPRHFRFLTRGLGTKEMQRNDLLALLLFQTDYVDRLIELGRADASAQLDPLLAFLR